MTDVNTTSTEDEFYDEAADEFPTKHDFEDRLVAIWPTGKTGTRPSEQAGQDPYPWVETITMALDDGPDGTAGEGMTSDKTPYLVGPAPATADAFQWSATGVFTRVAPRLRKKMADGSPDYRPVIGRINRRKNAKKGFSDSWSLGKPVESDRELVRQHEAAIRKMTAQVAAARGEAEDAAAFDA
jgi:hypothetical protein